MHHAAKNCRGRHANDRSGDFLRNDLPRCSITNQHDYDQLVAQYAHTDSYNSYTIGAAAAVSADQASMAGQNPMGMRIRKGVFDEMWAAPDGKGGVWVHHVTLAPGFEHTELLD